MLGRQIGHFKILALLGSGGMGFVYKAIDRKLDRTVALKFLPPDLTHDEAAKQRFLVEAKAASVLDHPNICTVHEIAETKNGQLYIAMGYYEGVTLAQRMDSGFFPETTSASSPSQQMAQLTPLDEILDIAIQIGQGLAAAHSRNIIHRDIKPANTMITQSGVVKILDFGTAKLASQSRLTKTGATPGTIAYMSPEQILGEEIDQRTDLWSLGVILYEMVTGRLPFQGDCEAALMYAIVNTQPDPVLKFRPEAPDPIITIIERALQKDPAHRYQSAQDFILDLQACQRTGVVLQATFHKKSKNRPAFAKKKTLFSLTALLSVVALLFILYWYSDRQPPATKPDRVFAIFPFTVRGAPGISYLQEGMMELLYTNLNSAGDLRCVDPRAMLNHIKLLQKPDVYIDDAIKIARFFGADYFMMGSLFAAEGQLRFNGALYDLESDGKSALHLYAESSDDRPFELVDGVSLQIVSKYSRALASSSHYLGNKTTHSLPALKAYLEGLKADRNGLIEEAYESYSQAVQLDSAFALAWFRRSLVNYGFLFKPVEAEFDLNRALQNKNKLSEHDRMVLMAQLSSVHGECEKAMTDFENIVAQYPDDVFGWESLAYNWLQWANLLGHSILEKWDAFQRLVALDPENGTHYQQMLVIALRRGHKTEIDSLIARLQEVSPNHAWAWPVIAPRAYIENDVARQAKMLRQAQSQDELILRCGIENSAVVAKNLMSLWPVTRTLLHRSRSKTAQAQGYLLLAMFDLSRGNWHDAMNKMDSMNYVAKNYGNIVRELYSPIKKYFIADAKTTSDQPSIEKWPEIKTPLPGATDFDFLPLPANLPYLKYYCSGLNSHFKGDSSRTIFYSQQLLQTPNPGEAASLIRLWAATLLALEAMQKHDHEAALNVLTKEPVTIRFPLNFGPIFNLSFQRFLRAELLNRLGRSVEALNWYRSIAETSVLDLPYRAPAAFRCAQIHDSLGNRREAIMEYQRFLEWWQNCDPDFKFMTRTAENRLKHLLAKKKQP